MDRPHAGRGRTAVRPYGGYDLLSNNAGRMNVDLPLPANWQELKDFYRDLSAARWGAHTRQRPLSTSHRASR